MNNRRPRKTPRCTIIQTAHNIYTSYSRIKNIEKTTTCNAYSQSCSQKNPNIGKNGTNFSSSLIQTLFTGYSHEKTTNKTFVLNAQEKYTKKLFTFIHTRCLRKGSTTFRKLLANISLTFLSAPSVLAIAQASFNVSARRNIAPHRSISRQSHTYEHSKGERRAKTNRPRCTHQSARTRNTFRQSSGNACARAGSGRPHSSSGSDESSTARFTAKGQGTSHNTSFLTDSKNMQQHCSSREPFGFSTAADGRSSSLKAALHNDKMESDSLFMAKKPDTCRTPHPATNSTMLHL